MNRSGKSQKAAGDKKSGVEFKLKNIGPIKDARLELGNLTVIAGANNTGKTYIVYTLYGLLQALHRPYLVFDAPEERRMTCERFKDSFYEHIENIENTFSSGGGIAETFASSPEQFPHALITVDRNGHTDEKIDFLLKEEVENNDNLRLEDGHLEIVPGSAEHRMAEARPEPYRRAGSRAVQKVMSSIAGKIFPQPFILSAERFGISLFYKELDFTKNRLVEALQKLDRLVETLQKLDDKNEKARAMLPFHLLRASSARYAQPIKDNIDFTRELEDHRKKASEWQREKLFDDIKDMMGGYYRYAGNELRFISKFRKKKGFRIPLYLASSSARGLSDLYFYMRHVAQKGQLLIIDEPESHLDTKNQLLFARLLARCVNTGIKVLITTHSDYIIKELNNLVMLSADFEEKSSFRDTYKKYYTDQDFLKPEAIKAYLCEKGTLSPCPVDGHGMIIRSFEDTIDRINRISNTLAMYVDSDTDQRDV